MPTLTLFEITADGMLTFKEAPDFEDANADNSASNDVDNVYKW